MGHLYATQVVATHGARRCGQGARGGMLRCAAAVVDTELLLVGQSVRLCIGGGSVAASLHEAASLHKVASLREAASCVTRASCSRDARVRTGRVSGTWRKSDEMAQLSTMEQPTANVLRMLSAYLHERGAQRHDERWT
jgi:hypothetical protein